LQGKKREQQCIEEQWQTITDTTPEAASAECRTEHADSQKQARPPLLPPLDAQHNVTRLTGTSHANSKNLMGFNQGNIADTTVDAQSLIKETMAEMTQEHDLALITHQEDSILDSNNHSTNETPTNEDAATEIIRHINHTVLHNSESLSRQTKKELLYWMVVLFPI
jgi:hypothetical protein